MINLKKFIEESTYNPDFFGIINNVKRISTDTRTIQEGDLFLALSGENFNGNKYLGSAIERGAKGCIYNRSDVNNDIKKLFTEYPEIFFIGVDNTEKYFQGLAKFHHKEWREGHSTVTVGITGSNGKTTTKEILAILLESIFPGRVLFTKGNLNNHLGLPMTLLRLEREHEICILEMGTNHPGEIEFLCNLGDPECGIITNIGQSHLEFFESETNVFVEKRNLYDYIIKKNGKVIVDGDNEFLKTLENKNLSSVGFDNGSIQLELNKTDLSLSGSLKLELKAPQLFGLHNFKNLGLAISLITSVFPGKESQLLKACLELKLPKNNRSELISANGKNFYLDAYNANPSSMKASIESFMQFLKDSGGKLEKSLFVLGDMNELGVRVDEYHEEIGKYLAELGIPNVIFVGRYGEFYLKGFKTGTVFKSTEDLKAVWLRQIEDYSSIFLKGSRTLQLESLMALN